MHIIGSKSSTTAKFLEAVSPKIALIGVGKNNSFGHPSDLVLERFKEKNIKVYRTDRNGEIIVELSKSGNLKFVNCYLQ